MSRIGSHLESELRDMAARGLLDELVQSEAARLQQRVSEMSSEIHRLREFKKRHDDGCLICGTLVRLVGFRVGSEREITLCDGCVDAMRRAVYEELTRSRDHRYPVGAWPEDEDDVAPPPKRDLYFARSLLGGDLIKIGISWNVDRRMADLQAEAILVLPGAGDRESQLHRRFASHRVRGEWFEPAPEILSYIEARLDRA